MKNSDTMVFTNIIPILEIRKNIKNIPKVSGVYKHYIDQKGLEYLEDVHPTTNETASDGKEVYLLYVGLSKNLYERIRWHIGMSCVLPKAILHGFVSTLRVSYMANHKDILCLSEQNKLDQFMDQHIYIQYMTTNDYKATESQLIKENDLPLNIKGNSHPFVVTNKIRRKAIKEKYKREHAGESSINKNAKIKTYPKIPNRSNAMIDDRVLREYARKAEKEGINNKSRFLRWFRDAEQQSAAQNRLNRAWIERNLDISDKQIIDIKNHENPQKNRNNTMIDDKVLREYARKAEKEGIYNKSRFLRWFRDVELQSAAQSRLYKAWNERKSDAS